MSNQGTALQRIHEVLSTPIEIKRMESMIPVEGLTPDRIISVAFEQIRRNPDLQKCNPDSLILAVRDAAKAGLLPDGITGQSYLVPFKGKAQLIIGYKGLINLVMNSGMVKALRANSVRVNDDFEVDEGTEARIRHKVDYRLDNKERGDLVAFYAIAEMTSGAIEFEVMSVEDVNNIRARVPGGGKSGPWSTHYEEMGKKTALRRLCKYLPQSVSRLATFDEHFEATGEVVHLSEDQYAVVDETAVDGAVESGDKPAEEEKPKRRRRASRAAKATGAAAAEPEAKTEPEPAQSEPVQPEPSLPNDDIGKIPKHLDRRKKGPTVDLTSIPLTRVGRGYDLDGWFKALDERLATITSMPELLELRDVIKPSEDFNTLCRVDDQAFGDVQKAFTQRGRQLNEGASPAKTEPDPEPQQEEPAATAGATSPWD